MTKREQTMLQIEIERIVRPIVEGQIRGFLMEHPKIVAAVDWYKPRPDKSKTFTNSLSKRIVRDLTCGITSARLEAAVVELVAAREPISDVAFESAPIRPRLESKLAWAKRIFGFTANSADANR